MLEISEIAIKCLLSKNANDETEHLYECKEKENIIDKRKTTIKSISSEKLNERRRVMKYIENAMILTRGGVLDLNLYGDVPTKKIFFTLFQNFCLQMIPCSRKNR